jgi:thiol-disulfide isomerase/thioredoxin
MKYFFSIIILVFIISCNNERPEPNFYKNLNTGELLNKKEFEIFRNSIYLKNSDSTKNTSVNFVFSKLEIYSDSIIQNFKYDLRIGDKYIVRSNDYKKIGMKIPQQTFSSINGEKIIIGGKKENPTLINLWFIHCPGCIDEIPALNKLKEKYSGKVDFVSLTFEKKEDVLDFLIKRKFDFTHIANVENFINEIGSYPYPENIFIDKEGFIRYIEGPIPNQKNSDLNLSIQYYEEIINKLL